MCPTVSLGSWINIFDKWLLEVALTSELRSTRPELPNFHWQRWKVAECFSLFFSFTELIWLWYHILKGICFESFICALFACQSFFRHFVFVALSNTGHFCKCCLPPFPRHVLFRQGGKCVSSNLHVFHLGFSCCSCTPDFWGSGCPYFIQFWLAGWRAFRFPTHHFPISSHSFRSFRIITSSSVKKQLPPEFFEICFVESLIPFPYNDILHWRQRLWWHYFSAYGPNVTCGFCSGNFSCPAHLSTWR